MQTTIIYLYGWGGGAHSKGLLALQEASLLADIITWDYNQKDPTNNYDTAEKLMNSIDKKSKVLLIGNSLGGYWANYLAEQYQLETILINPSLYPKETLGNYKVAQHFLDAYKPSVFGYKNKWLFLSKQDTVINPKIAEEAFKDCNGTFWLEEPHAIQDYTFLVDKVKEWIVSK